jgi:hypothetical protein
MKRTHDLAVKVGEYQSEGKTKNRYRNVGTILQGDDGNELILIDPTFNFAAVKLQDGRDMVMVSKFEVKATNSESPTEY